MSELELTEISNDYSPGYYVEGDPDDPYSSGTIAGRGTITSEIQGEFRRLVLEKVGVEDHEGLSVTVEEDHYDIGYCVTCSYECVRVSIRVDDTEVYSDPYGDNAFDALNHWLHYDEEA